MHKKIKASTIIYHRLPYFWSEPEHLLKVTHQDKKIEAGCDEAGRGCLAGPVFAAAVILPPDFYHPLLNDSKQVDEPTRKELRKYIRTHALAYSVAAVDHEEIDKINILKASFKAMHLALDKLKRRPKFLLIDGNRFIPYKKTPHACIVKGDATYASIAAASILAKTYRDDFMRNLHRTYPQYNWRSNKGYATPDHRKAIETHGLSPFHRRTFYTCAHRLQLELELDELGPEYHLTAAHYELAQSPEVYNLIQPANLQPSN